MRWCVVLVLLMGVPGCVLPPLTIRSDSEPVPVPTIAIVVVSEATRPEPTDPQPTREVHVPRPSPRCPTFELPVVGEQPTVPIIPMEHRGDTDYLVDVLIGHIEVLIDDRRQVIDTYTDAYRRYLNNCKR